MSNARNTFKWSAVDRLFTQLFQFVTLIVLSRLLPPESFGLIGMTAVFISLSQVLIDGGFTSALIRKKKINQAQYSTVFYFNLVVSLIIYILVFFSAPYISMFYGESSLIDVLRILSISILINALTVVFRVKLIVSFDFKSQAIISFISGVVSALFGIYFAFHSPSVWALVYQTLIFSLCNLVLLFIKTKWYPSLSFSKDDFYDLFSFGYKIILSSVIEILYSNSFIMLIGKLYSAAQLGFFYQAKRLIEIPTNTYISIIQRVNLPLMSQVDSEDELLANYSKALDLATFLFLPFVCIIAIASNSVFYYVLGESWLPAVKYFLILTVCYSFYPIHMLNLNMLQVKKRSDLYLKVEIIKKVIGVGFLLVFFQFGIIGICISISCTSFISLFVNCYFCNKVIDFGVVKQFQAFSKHYLVNFAAVLCVYLYFDYPKEDTITLFSLLLYLFIIVLLYGCFYFDSTKNNIMKICKV
jgi:O-antigen/teichoic acid export membrane protein